jgi:HlyD family type I secretion membrane fusion protein
MMARSSTASPGVPGNPLPAIAFGMAVILFGLGSFAAWASIAGLSSAIVASGTLKVLNSRKKVQTAEGGVVRELAVQNGVQVAAGDVLVRLDDTMARSSLEILQSNYDQVRAAVARLHAERDGAAAIAFPQDLLARADNTSVADVLDGQRALFTARRRSLDGQVAMSRERIGRLEEEIIGLEAQSDAKAQQIVIITREHGDLKDLLAKGLVQRPRVLALEREVLRLQGEKGEHDAGIARTRRQIAETELEILQLTRNFEKEVSDALGEKETEMFGLAERVASARHTLDQQVIRATATGIVVGLDVHTVGGVLQPGATLLEIVPVEDNLVIEAQIRPVDIDNVTVGQDADVVFSAFPHRQIPRSAGRVTYVSADVLSEPRTGAAYYVAHVAVSPEDLADLKEFRLIPGMPVEVFVRTGERTPLAYLVQPLRDSISRAWREP